MASNILASTAPRRDFLSFLTRARKTCIEAQNTNDFDHGSNVAAGPSAAMLYSLSFLRFTYYTLKN